MKNDRDYNRIPGGACTLVVGEFEVGDNGDGAKSAPVRLVARSGKPIEHWFWGRVVHDLAGMHLHKSRLPIDYVHDAKEVIGYLNKFSTESGDLVTSGALVPYKDGDRATEILHKLRAGVPYEASINFGGDGIKVEELADGQVAQVNGFQFEGPGVIVREWPLRGVAVCPYGADMNTKSAEFSVVTYTAAVMAAAEAREERAMSEQSVEVAAEVPQPSEAVNLESVEAKPEETPEAEAAAAVEAAAQVVEPEQVVEAAQDEPKPELSRDEFVRIADDFGADMAVRMVKDGGNYDTALRLSHESLKAEVAQLRAAAVERSAQPVPVVAAKKEVKLFNTGK